MGLFANTLIFVVIAIGFTNSYVIEDQVQYYADRHNGAGILVLSLIAPGRGRKTTIHGLWPQYSKKRASSKEPDPFGPLDCMNKDYCITLGDQFTHLTQEMTSKWPNRQDATDNRKFWEHEWKKHGMCLDGLGKGCHAAFVYYNLGLKLYDKYIMKIESTIKVIQTNPDKQTVGEIQSEFERHLGKKVEITCSNNMVSEIHLCIDINTTKDRIAQDEKSKQDTLLLHCNRNLGTGYPNECPLDTKIKFNI